MRRLRPLAAPAAVVAAAGLTACGATPEDWVQDLGHAERREAARQELLLAKERAVGPLLASLEGPAGDAAGRAVLVEILVSLMMRVEDERLPEALAGVLRSDPDPEVRSRVARFAGMHRRAELAGALLDALDDEAGPVRHEALLALTGLGSKLTPEQAQRFEARQQAFLQDPYPGVRAEALIVASRQVDELLQQAQRAVLEARLTAAESLYAHIVAVHPHSQRARYREGRYHLDNGRVERGLRVLREAGVVLDVPRWTRAPVIDGRLDEDLWATAARADSLFSYSHMHTAALPAQQAASLHVAYTHEALYIGFRGEDEAPDELVARFTDEATAEGYEGGPVASTIWTDDIIELFVDADFDHRDYAHMGINSFGVRADEWVRGPLAERMRLEQTGEDWNDDAWRADDEVAAHVGDASWSVEYRLNFGSPEFPQPSAGDLWGFNLVRVYRGQEYSQWVRTYRSGHSPDDFGVLHFQ